MQHNRHSYVWITVSFVSQSHSGCLVIYLYEAMKSQFISESCWLFSLLNTCTCIWLLSHSFSFHCEQWVIQIFLYFCDIILFYRFVCFPLDKLYRHSSCYKDIAFYYVQLNVNVVTDIFLINITIFITIRADLR